MKIIEALQWGERELKEAKVENPRWDADLLLSEVLGWRREQLYLEREHFLQEKEWERYLTFLKRRKDREPLQYIIKKQEFMGLSFYVDKRVLIPRADSEVLVEKLLELKEVSTGRTEDSLRKNRFIESPARIADLCTGSGALAVSIAYFWPKAFVVGTDVSPDALEIAKRNALQNKVEVEWREGDFLEPIRGERWDWIITNPPYIPESEYRSLAPELFQEPEIALLAAENGLIFYRRLAREVSTVLTENGRILMEIGWNQGEAVQELFQKEGFRTQVFPDYGGRDRVVLAEFMTR